MKKKLTGLLFFVAVLGFTGTVMAEDGAGLYKTKCLVCHGIEGRGTALAPGFKESVFINSSTDKEITDVILNGSKGTVKKFTLSMPPQKLDEAEVKSLVEYLKGLAKVD